METLLMGLGYITVVVFAVAVANRVRYFANTPVHLRWELYPVPHEAPEKLAYGGSYMEESDNWDKPHKTSPLNELKEMFAEMVFIKALFENNKKLWIMSFPFHFGMYLLAAFIGLLVLGGLLGAFGMTIGSGGSGLGLLLGYITPLFGFLGFTMAFLGSLGLLVRRLTDPELTDFTGPVDYLNLMAFVALFFVGLSTMLMDPMATGFQAWFHGVLTLSPATDLPLITTVTILYANLMIMYIPLTHMSHFVAKYYTYHDVRWADEPLLPGNKLDKAIQAQLNYPVTWAAEHIKADGKKTWGELAMINPAKEEETAK